jgi:hypothetical protein
MRKKAGLTGFELKMLAIAFMLMDHVGAILPISQPFANALRCAGRLAFPMFAFLICEGYAHTRSVKAYVVRLAAFALISELPFNLLLSHRLFDPSGQNIFFTLLIGLLTILALETIGKKTNASAPMSFPKVCAIAAGMAAAAALRSDYGAFGVVVILAFHMFRDNKKKALFAVALMCAAEGAAAGLYSGSLYGAVEALAALSAIPLYFYNGKKGASMKYFFYAFYPTHIAVLALIKVFVFHVPLNA